MLLVRQVIFIFIFQIFLFANSNLEHSMRKSLHLLDLLLLHLRIPLGRLKFLEMEELESNLRKFLG